MQLEDDVRCAENFVDAIKSYISVQRKIWACLEFSELGFIGKLFKSADLKKLSTFMMTFYDEQPVDWLIRYFRMSMAQPDVLLRKPTLFQHIGLKSSFDTSKLNKLKDRYFDEGTKPIKIVNPEADLITDIRQFKDYKVDMSYLAGSGFFWGIAPKKDQAVFVIFKHPVVIKRIFVQTGNEQHAKDILSHGTVKISPTVKKLMKGSPSCSGFLEVGTFVHGGIDEKNLDSRYPEVKTQCLQILVTESQKEWLIINQIAVFTTENQGTYT